MAKAPYHFTVGEFECTVIQLGERPVDATKMFANVSEEEVSAAFRARGFDPNAMELSVNLLYVKTPEHHILVDSGPGKASFLPGSNDVSDDLKTAGIDPDAIDHVIITHAHWDHIGGLMTENGNLSFPNARYSMWKGEWDFWTSEAELTKMGEQDPNPPYVRTILPALRERIAFVDHESELLLGVCAIPAPGHTVGQIAVLFTSNGEGLLHVADAAHNPIQVDYPNWTPGYDPLLEASKQSRHQLVERAARENLLMVGYHFPFPGLGYVREQDGAYRWEAITD
jgi:glyoxylase-like metal-dependent hydrolase (beta-lactamase superfamily II)